MPISEHNDRQPANQRGLSYLEVMVASVILALAAIPALDAMGAAGASGNSQPALLAAHYSTVAAMEVLATESYTDLLAAAAAAGSSTVSTSYSNSNLEVFIARYDGDGSPFTVPDPNLDSDNNPFTGYVGMLWLRVAPKAAAGALETLVAP